MNEVDLRRHEMKKVADIEMHCPSMKEFVTEATIDNLDVVQGFISEVLEAYGCPMKMQTQIALAVEEIFINITQYAYAPKTGSVIIRIAVGGNIIIEFEDNGKPYNPLMNKDPDITCDPEKRRIGGLGVFMVKSIMDAIEYRHEGNKNILLIKKAAMRTI